jgi:NH3-dependent NAD+ synthetase
VYDLARFCNRHAHDELIPVTTIERAPSAELEVGQTDETSLPAGYDVLVPLVNAVIEKHEPYESLVAMYGSTVVDKTLRLIRLAEGKRRQLPPAIRVTDRAFGIERRVPMDYPDCGIAV